MPPAYMMKSYIFFSMKRFIFIKEYYVSLRYIILTELLKKEKNLLNLCVLHSSSIDSKGKTLC